MALKALTFVLVMLFGGRFMASAQVYMDIENVESSERFVGQAVADAAEKVFKQWRKTNKGLPASTVSEVVAHLDTAVVLRMMATSYDGKALAVAYNKRPVSQLILSYKGVVLGYYYKNEVGESGVVAKSTPNVLAAIADESFLRFLQLAKQKRLFAVIGVDEKDRLFYLEDGALHRLDESVVVSSDVVPCLASSDTLIPVYDESQMVQVVMEHSDKKNLGGVLGTSISSTAACVILAIVLLI